MSLACISDETGWPGGLPKWRQKVETDLASVAKRAVDININCFVFSSTYCMVLASYRGLGKGLSRVRVRKSPPTLLTPANQANLQVPAVPSRKCRCVRPGIASKTLPASSLIPWSSCSVHSLGLMGATYIHVTEEGTTMMPGCVYC